ncbi:hypothetical protein [Paraburkholderia sp. CNPSo 3076]|uniref:hypothetical protein n=1 Tax=Paraburkholderia sp. CNPSo 3076 TaxID=2940936 RepID=UPI002253BB79|nr:hypothetical protein [Paraburkholderia sp. CNPSo 3076]
MTDATCVNERSTGIAAWPSVEVPVDVAGLAGVQRYLRASLETDVAAAPRRLFGYCGTTTAQSDH